MNEGNDINTANYMKVAIESYGGVKGFYATVVEIQDSFQSMTKHSMTGIRALNNFLFDSAGLRAWKAYNVGTGRLFLLAQLQKYVLKIYFVTIDFVTYIDFVTQSHVICTVV